MLLRVLQHYRMELLILQLIVNDDHSGCGPSGCQSFE